MAVLAGMPLNRLPTLRCPNCHTRGNVQMIGTGTGSYPKMRLGVSCRACGHVWDTRSKLVQSLLWKPYGARSSYD